MVSAYELMLILRPQLSNEEQKEVFARLKKSIKTEGKISQPSHYGKLDLAYPIKKEDQGDYWTWVIATDPKEIAPFTLKLKSEDGLLRFLLLKKRIKADVKKIKSEKKAIEKE